MRNRLAAAVVALLLTTGCATGPESPTEPVVDAALQQAYAAANLDPCPSAPANIAPVADGLPNLTLHCLDTASQSTLSGLPKGRPMVINLWAQWCGPCREEAPYLASVSRRTAGTVNFLGIDTADPQPERAIEFAKLAGWTYPQLSDPEKATSKPPLRVPGLPHTIFVDAGGKVVGAHSGPFTSEAELDGYLRDLLGVDA